MAVVSGNNTEALGKYRIGVVSRITGISQHALRVWERRYGSFDPVRTEAGGRLYTDADISRFILIKKLLDRGHSIGRLAKLPTGELERIFATYQVEKPEPLPSPDIADIRRKFLSAINLLDIQQAEQILQRAAATLNSRTLVIDLIVPIVQEVGARWERGDFRVFHEHAATAILRNLIATQLKAYAPGASAPAAVITTPSGEQHEFGALIVGMLIASRGWRIFYLGTSLPAADIVDAVKSSRAGYLFISIAACRDGDLTEELKAVTEAIPDGVKMVIGGGGAPRYHAALPGLEIITELSDFEEWLDRR